MFIGPDARIDLGPIIGSEASQFCSAADVTAKTGLTLSAFYGLQQASGVAVDSVAGLNLAVSGTPTTRVPVGGTNGVHFNAASNGYFADVLDVGLNSFLMAVVATHPTAFASLPGICGRGATSTFPCFLVYRANNTLNYPTLLLRDSVASVVVAPSTIDVVTHKKPVLYLAYVDRSTNNATLLCATSDQILGSNTQSVATLGTFSGGTGTNFQIGGINALSGGAAVSTVWLAMGAQCNNLNLTSICKKLGWGGV
jgi:hypothetical protein